MNRSKAEAIVSHLLVSVADVRYGDVSVIVRMHDGKLVSVTYSKTENTREQEIDEKKKNTELT